MLQSRPSFELMEYNIRSDRQICFVFVHDEADEECKKENHAT